MQGSYKRRKICFLQIQTASAFAPKGASHRGNSLIPAITKASDSGERMQLTLPHLKYEVYTTVLITQQQDNYLIAKEK
ncbi:MAG: hypothetical protein ACSLEN_08050 [Candidatus Malihini olakiniferum]